MLIQCTKKLLDQLKIKPADLCAEKEREYDAQFSWHANLITVDRRKTVVLVHDNSHYVLILHGLKAKDFKNLGDHILASIRETFLAELIKEEVVTQFIAQSPGISYTKTKNRSTVARLNKTCEIIGLFSDFLTLDSVIQSTASIKASGCLIGDGANGYIYPFKELFDDLAAFYGGNIFSCRAVELETRLNLVEHKVWRNVIVPLSYTFRELHHVMQVLYDWSDYHLHCFQVYKNRKPLLELVCNEGAFDYPSDIPRLMDMDIRLSEYMPQNKKFIYSYDFGDDWQHDIKVVRVIETFTQNHAVCLSGEGNAPPEDVGGEGGYDDFLAAIADVDNPEHEEMVSWGIMQLFKDFKLDFVNRELQSVRRSRFL